VALEDLQAAASADWGGGAWWHAGGLAWDQPLRIDRVDRTWVWSDGDTVAVLGQITAGVMGWAEAAGAQFLVDHRRLQLPVVADAAFFLDVRRRAESLEPLVVEGIRLGAVEDEAAFIACHRDAWAPQRLPFTTPRSFAADMASTFDAPRWALVRSNPWFDPDLVVVAYDRQDQPVGSCIAWYDRFSGSAEIEPLGVTPGARGRGIAKSLTIEAVRRVAGLGGTEVVVRPRGDPDYPVPRGVYAACGFLTHARNHLYRLNERAASPEH